MSSTLIDSHCHINMIDDPGGSAAIVKNARAAGVEHMLCVSVDMKTYPEVRQLADRFDSVSVSTGVHPNTSGEEELTVEQLARLAGDDSVVAVGETGLDYFRSSGDLEWQRERFRTHIRAAVATGKPLIIHSREAKADVIEILRQEQADRVGGVMHCFVDDLDTARQAMDLNFLISFSGIVTFKNATDLQEVAQQVPLENMLVETDSPYLAPVPYRGKQNQPAYVKHVAAKIAELKGIDMDVVCSATTANYRGLFG